MSLLSLDVKGRKTVPATATRIATDAEWYGQYFITRQFTFADDDLKPLLTVVLWDNAFPLPSDIPSTLELSPNTSHALQVIPCNQSDTILDFFLFPKNMKVYMFYSPKDLTGMFGRPVFRDILEKKDKDGNELGISSGLLSKKRNISGEFEVNGTTFKLQDCLGLFNSSLEAGMESVGIDISDSKKLAKKWDKSHMNVWATNDPNGFLKYAVGDTVLLLEAVLEKVKQVNVILNNSFPGLELGNYTHETIKYSSGSLVNDVWVRWFATAHTELFRTMLRLSDSNSDKAWDKLNSLTKKLQKKHTPEELLKISKGLKSDGFGKNEGSTVVHGMAACSIRAFALGHTGTVVFCALVMGGRCINETPSKDVYNSFLKNIIDIDLKSCYGSALANFVFPVGLPTLFGNMKNDVALTLGEFLAKYGNDLVDDLYTINVTGNFVKMAQDLVHSKYDVDTVNVLKKLIGDFENKDTGYGSDIEAAHIGGDFVLTKKEIKLGIITSEVLKVIKAVSTAQELSEWMSLKVESTAYYPKTLRLDNNAFVESLDNNIGGKYRDKRDTLNRHWTTVSIKDFIGNFLTYRKKVQKESSSKGDTADIRQQAVKLFVNTTYGCMAAPYFEMGNTVLANNITAKARVGVWMMSKALLTAQSITDGGLFSGDKVAFLKVDASGKVKKPGFTALSDRDTFLSLRSVGTVELIAEKDKTALVFPQNKTKDQKKADGDKLDGICTDHVNKFWTWYELSLPFDIECKYEQCGAKAATAASADYIIELYPEQYRNYKSDPKTGEIFPDANGNYQYDLGKTDKRFLIKTRGAKQYNHPKKQFMKHLLYPELYPLPNVEFKYVEQLGLNDFLKSMKVHNAVLPGEDIGKTFNWKPWKKGFLFDTEKAYKADNKARDKAVTAWEKANLKVDDKEYFAWSSGLRNVVDEASWAKCYVDDNLLMSPQLLSANGKMFTDSSVEVEFPFETSVTSLVAC